MKLIDKAAVVAEIEKLKAYLQIPNAQLDAIKVCDNVINVIDTLEVKEVDLDKEMYLQINELHTPFHYEDYKELKNFAKHFYELGLKAQKGE